MGYPRPELIRVRFYRTESGKYRKLRTYRCHGSTFGVYTNIPRMMVFIGDIIYIKAGKYKGNTYKVVDKFPRFPANPAYFVWIRISEERRFERDLVCLPITDIVVIECCNVNVIRKNNRPKKKPEDRLTRAQARIALEKNQSRCRYDNWVADFNDNYNKALTDSEIFIFRALKKNCKKSHYGDSMWWTPHKVAVATSIYNTANFIFKRISLTIFSLIQKRRLEYVPIYGVLQPVLHLRIIDETE